MKITVDTDEYTITADGDIDLYDLIDLFDGQMDLRNYTIVDKGIVIDNSSTINTNHTLDTSSK